MCRLALHGEAQEASAPLREAVKLLGKGEYGLISRGRYGTAHDDD